MCNSRFGKFAQMALAGLVCLFAVEFIGAAAPLYVPSIPGGTTTQDQDREEASPQRTLSNQLRQLGLGMFNYEAAYNKFPLAAKRDKAGKPLLSWRVQLLPYLDELELYQEFKMDEPWDSEHNRKLIARMPAVFRDPYPGSEANNEAGKTVFQVPVAEGSMFGGDKPIGLRNIVDGTSNTVMLVAVAPEHAVEWTRPSDWDVDLEKPFAKLQGKGREGFGAGLADGSVRWFPIEPEAVWLRQMLTIRGGEIVDWPK